MNEKIKSGKELIDDFFSQIKNIKDLDEKTVEAILTLYENGKLTDTNLQNIMNDLLSDELKKLDLNDE
jgi:hypothetical protein